MKKAAIKETGAIEPPRLPKRLNPAFPETIGEQDTFEAQSIADCSIDDQAAEFVTFETSHLKQVTMQRAQLRSLRLLDTRFEACDLSGSEWEQISATRTELLGCRLIGLQASDGRIEQAIFRGCNAAHAQFWGTVFKQARFENCNLNEASFSGADLSGVVFEKCDLRGANFVDAKLHGADLRSSQIDGARLGAKEIQGLIVNTEQAISIARLLGADVRLD